MFWENVFVWFFVVNIDIVILVFLVVELDFFMNFVDCFLVVIEKEDIKLVICISKMDLVLEFEKE